MREWSREDIRIVFHRGNGACRVLGLQNLGAAYPGVGDYRFDCGEVGVFGRLRKAEQAEAGCGLDPTVDGRDQCR